MSSLSNFTFLRCVSQSCRCSCAIPYTSSKLMQYRSAGSMTHRARYGGNINFLKNYQLLTVPGIQVVTMPHLNSAAMAYRLTYNDNEADFDTSILDFEERAWVAMFARQSGPNGAWYKVGVSKISEGLQVLEKEQFLFPSTSQISPTRQIKYINLEKVKSCTLYRDTIRSIVSERLCEAYENKPLLSISDLLQKYSHARDMNSVKLFCDLQRYVMQPLGFPIRFLRKNPDSDVANLEIGDMRCFYRLAAKCPGSIGYKFDIYLAKTTNKLKRFRPINQCEAPAFFITAFSSDFSDGFKSDGLRGIFIFPKQVIADRGVFSTDEIIGKTALMVHPPFLDTKGGTPLETQIWQAPYFIDFQTETPEEYLPRIQHIFETYNS